MHNYIFGAKATAVGLLKALMVREPDRKIQAFLVSKPEGNPSDIFGIPVEQISSVAKKLTESEKKQSIVYVAVPELIHQEVRELLEAEGFHTLIMLDSRREIEFMEQYFQTGGAFPSIHALSAPDNRTLDFPKLTVYAASFYKDKPLLHAPVFPSYVKKIMLGCDGAIKNGVEIRGKADVYDNSGDNISEKNPNRCEMTAHYWVWKNALQKDDYVGICHYRRMLDLSDEDIKKMVAHDVDVILPYPMIHYPNAGIQHTWYVKDRDWELLKKVVMELYPEYGERLDDIFSAQEFYNYNMLIAKRQVFADYCAWLYPILDRIEELSDPKGTDRHDRYTAYMSESLTTLYFMVNCKHLKIYHTGRLLFA